jgi:electron transfer flavoprotein beta subunit
MKSIVIFKWSMNPQDARVGADGSVDWLGTKLAPNDDDPAAIGLAKDLAAGGEVVGLTLGDGDSAWAAARGANRTVVVADSPTGLDSAATGAALAAAVQFIGPADVVLVGDSSWDYGVVSALAGHLGWPALASVESAKLEGGQLRVTRKLGSAIQVVDVAGPALLAVAASRAEQHVPGMKEVLAARKKPITRLALADLKVPATAAVALRGTRLPESGVARMFDGSDPAAAAAQVVAALRTDGVL